MNHCNKDPDKTGVSHNVPEEERIQIHNKPSNSRHITRCIV